MEAKTIVLQRMVVMISQYLDARLNEKYALWLAIPYLISVRSISMLRCCLTAFELQLKAKTAPLFAGFEA